MNDSPSSIRAQLRQVQQQLPELIQECFGREPILPGSLYNLRRKCGKPNCRCARGELHASIVLSHRGDGPPRNISPPPEQIEALRKMTDDYRRARKARAKLVRWQKQLLALIDELEALRVGMGEAELRKRRASATWKPRSPRK